MRFDDHTPLPDDFGLDEDLSHSAPERKAEPEPVMQVEPQTEIDLSDPDEWTDILDEFESIAEELAEPEPEIAWALRVLWHYVQHAGSEQVLRAGQAFLAQVA